VQPLLKIEIAQLGKSVRAGMPRNTSEAQSILEETRQRGLGRVVDTLLPGISGLAAPVWDAGERICLSLVSLGSSASFDASDKGSIAKALRECSAHLSSELGSKR
jgi:DNA-binding IclR family transcriptional regulator